MKDNELVKVIMDNTDLTLKEVQDAIAILKIKENNYIFDFYDSFDDIDIADDENIEEQVFVNITNEILLKILDKLTDREKDVICMRYGIISGREYTLEEIGIHMKVTRERIRQIEATALRKLKHLSKSKYLKGPI